MIKLLVIAGLSTIACLSMMTIPVQAESKNTVSNSMTPRELISLARQGGFTAQGIPGYSALGSAIRSGKVDAEKLIASAVAQKRLPQSALQDSIFIAEVSQHLKSGGCGSN